MFFGLVTIVAIILAASFVISMLLRFTGLTEASFTTITLVISFAALFIGGLISGRKAHRRGWINGAGTGLLYALVVFFVQFLGFDKGFSGQQYLFFLLYILAASFGGMIGVNLAGSRREE